MIALSLLRFSHSLRKIIMDPTNPKRLLPVHLHNTLTPVLFITYCIPPIIIIQILGLNNSRLFSWSIPVTMGVRTIVQWGNRLHIHHKCECDGRADRERSGSRAVCQLSGTDLLSFHQLNKHKWRIVKQKIRINVWYVISYHSILKYMSLVFLSAISVVQVMLDATFYKTICFCVL